MVVRIKTCLICMHEEQLHYQDSGGTHCRAQRCACWSKRPVIFR